MERELYRLILQALRELPPGPRRGRRYCDDQILEVFFWALLHDRPVSWACQAVNWPPDLCRRPRPSQPTMSRRLRQLSLRLRVAALEIELRQRLPQGLLKYLDGKPLPVGGCSKDPDATWGRGAGGLARGYKIVCLVDQVSGAVDRWTLGPMNLCEHQKACSLLSALPEGCWLVADTSFDKSGLYRQAAQEQLHLVAPRKASAKALGHRPQEPARLAAQQLLATETGRQLIRCRLDIERSLGQMTCFGGGLGPLPAWVRRPQRVALWVCGKLIIDLARRLRLRQKKSAG